MSFLNPKGLFLFLLLPIIPLLYFKKKQVDEKEVSYIGLFREVIEEIGGVKKRKIDKYLLLFVQLIIATLIVLTFSKPLLMAKTPKGSKVNLFLDSSFTMNFETEDGIRFDDLVEKAKDYIDTLEASSDISVYLLDSNCTKVIETKDKKQIKNKLDEINCSYSPLDISKAENVLKTIEGYHVFFSDKNTTFGDQVIRIENSGVNVGIIDASFDYYTREAIFRVKNYTKTPVKTAALLKQDDKILDIQEVTLDKGKIVDVKWKHIPKDCDFIEMCLDIEDIFEKDNSFILPVNCKKKVLMMTQNYYLQKALESIPYIQLFTGEKVEPDEVYDLYITDKAFDEEAKNVFYLTSPKNCRVHYIDDIAKVSFADSLFSKNLLAEDFKAKDLKVFEENSGIRPILTFKDKIAMGYKYKKDKKRVYLSLDLDKTDLVYSPDFPILIDEIMHWFFDEKESWYQMGPFPIGNEKPYFEGINANFERLKSLLIISILSLLFVEWKVYCGEI